MHLKQFQNQIRFTSTTIKTQNSSSDSKLDDAFGGTTRAEYRIKSQQASIVYISQRIQWKTGSKFLMISRLSFSYSNFSSNQRITQRNKWIIHRTLEQQICGHENSKIEETEEGKRRPLQRGSERETADLRVARARRGRRRSWRPARSYGGYFLIRSNMGDPINGYEQKKKEIENKKSGERMGQVRSVRGLHLGWERQPLARSIDA